LIDKEEAMVVLFVHGMGRSPLSAWPMLRALRHAGFITLTFGYSAALESTDAIRQRLVERITSIAQSHDYLIIGHSLGGVFARAALNAMPADVRRPQHVYLLGSPVQASTLAQRLQRNVIFKLLTHECGQLLADQRRMAEIATIDDPLTAFAGTRSIPVTQGYFNGQINDGIVSLAEVSAPWITQQIQVPVMHGLLPASRLIADLIIKNHRA
jgi:pimeloyl-ACP methyl ester carboxylesterase